MIILHSFKIIVKLELSLQTMYMELHTSYIYNWSLKTFSQDYDLTPHTTYICYYMHEWHDLQFKVVSE